MYLFLSVLGLCCFLRAFSSCSKWGPPSRGAQATHCGGFSCCKARALGAQASVVAECRLNSCDFQALEHKLSSCGTRA